MTQTERRKYLIAALLKEQLQYAELEIPSNEQEQKAFVLYFYHQASHMAELCHINIKRRLGRHILFPNKVL
ncbi:MAG: hypothetical protein ACOX8M_08230 [Marvinbryantia sp.]|jgi:hypothetical protein